MIIEVRWRDAVQRMTYEDFERRVRDGEVGPETLVRFDAVTGGEFRPASELELFGALVDTDALAFRERLRRRVVPLATALLVGVQIRIYLWSKLPEVARWLQDHLTNGAPAVLENGEVWRLLTYSLVHVDFAHILFNLLFIAYTGYHLERTMGRVNLLLLFFGSAFAGGLFSLAFSGGTPTLGASGGGFGMLSASVVFGWKYWDNIPASARKYFGFAILPYPLVSILTNINAENVDNWCHLGGLLGGVVLMGALEPDVYQVTRAANRRVGLTTLGIMLLGSAGLAAYGPRVLPLVTVAEEGVSFARPAYWREGWAFTGERGWFSPTGDAWLVLATDIAPHPQDADEATDALIADIRSKATDTELLSRREAIVAGATGRWVGLGLRLEGRSQRLLALVVVRGVYTYRVLLLTAGEASQRLAPLADRLFRDLQLSEPPELVEARAQAAANPRSWSAQVALGTLLSRVGDVPGALASFSLAEAIAPQEPGVWVGKLNLYADYALPDTEAQARLALDTVPLEPHVIVAAAQAMRSLGQEAEGAAILERGWLALPGDRTLKKARKAWNLPTELPEH